MKYRGIKFLGVSGFAYPDTPDLEGNWLKSYDPDANGGNGDIQITDDPSLAMRFEKVADALALFHKDSATLPTRADGFPNKPMMRYYIEIGPLPADVQVQARSETRGE